MALPSGGSEQNFIATVAVVVDPDTLGQAGAQIKAALDKAVGSVSPVSLKGLAEGLTAFTKEQEKAILQAEKIKAAIEKTTAAEEKTAQAKAKTVEAAARLSAAEERRQRAQDALQAKFDSSLQKLNQMYTVENQISTKSQEQLQAESALADALARQNVLLNEQEGIQARLAAANPNLTNPNFNIGNLLGTIGGNFQANVLSGQGIGGAASSALTQLQQSLYQVSLGGEKATAAFANLGIEGVGAVSGLTSGLAGVGAGLLAILPLALQFGQALTGAYESQKELVFQSGLLSKQLGLSAEEGAKVRSLLTLVGQEDNIFASITLSQIQASIAALDQVDKGLQKASPQVEAFGKALKDLGISYTTETGGLKNFTDIVVELSAALEKLPASQRSLEIQRLAGLFGGDVAKLFGFGPDILTKNLESAVAVSAEAQKQNDALRESAVELTNAQAALNLTFFSGIGSIEQFSNVIQTKAILGIKDLIVAGRDLLTLLNLPGAGAQDQGYLERRAAAVKADLDLARQARDQLGDEGMFGTEPYRLASQNLVVLEGEYAKLLKQLDALRGKDKALKDLGAANEQATPTATVEGYKELDKALADVEKAEKAVAKAQEDIAKNNLDVAKSFDSQINALQKTASGYDSYYEKVGETLGKINAIQAKEGKPFSFIGTGTVKDVEKAIVDLRVLEERLGKMGEKGAGAGDPKYDQLLLNITRRRTALGLQPGELTEAANVDITVGITGLSRKQREELNALFQQLLEFKREFLQGGFDVAQSTFSQFINGLADSLSGNDFKTLLAGGATTLQAYAESLGLFSSPGFAQAIGEAALKSDLLAGAFGNLNTAAGANAAFAKYTEALGNLRKDLFDLSDYISGGKQLTIPIAIEFGLITQGAADLAAIDPAALKANADRLLQAGEITVEQYRQRITEAAQARGDVADLGGGQGIVELLLGKYGISTDEAIEATAKFVIAGEFDVTLAQKEADAQAELLRKEENSRTIAVKWNIEIDPVLNTEQLRNAIQAQIDDFTNAPPTPTGPSYGPQPRPPGNPYTYPITDYNTPPGGAAGGHFLRNIPFLANEEGKGELYVSGRDGYILPGNDTANLLRGMGSRERLPQANITYAPVVNNNLSVDARGTNARDVTQAIQRTQAKQSLFTSSKPFLRDRDFLRAHGLR